jgi:hypothetical protein
MAGAGFEPAKAEPTDLQSVPFDRSGIPPGALSLARHRRVEWNTALDFEPLVLRAAEVEAATATHLWGWNQPPPAITNYDEEVVVLRRIQCLDQPTPTAVTAAGAEGDAPTTVLKVRRRLDLHSFWAFAPIGNEVKVRVVVKQRYEDRGAAFAEPEGGGELTLVALAARISFCLHDRRVRLTADRKALQNVTFLSHFAAHLTDDRDPTTRRATAAPRAAPRAS